MRCQNLSMRRSIPLKYTIAVRTRSGAGPLLRNDRSAAFLQRDDAIGRPARNPLPLSSGPLDFDVVVLGGIGEPEMQSRIVLRQIARSRLYFAGEPVASGVNVHARADGVAI